MIRAPADWSVLSMVFFTRSVFAPRVHYRPDGGGHLGRGRLADLHEGAARRAGVDECDKVAVCAAPRPLIDQPYARLGEADKFCFDIGDAVGDMVQPRATIAAKAFERRLWIYRLQQFDRRVSRGHPDDVHALIGDTFAVANIESEQRVKFFCLLEIRDDERDVVHRAAVHRTSAAGRCAENISRKASQTSPSVQPSSTAAMNAGMSGAPEAAATLTSASRSATSCPSRRARNAASAPV